MVQASSLQLWPKARVLSPLARGTTGGVVRTNEDPLPQKTRRPPWKRGTNVRNSRCRLPACSIPGLADDDEQPSGRRTIQHLTDTGVADSMDFTPATIAENERHGSGLRRPAVSAGSRRLRRNVPA